MSDWTDEVSPVGGSPSRGRDASIGHRSARGSITEDVTVGSITARPASGGTSDSEDVAIGPRGGRVLSDGAKRMLANLDKHDAVTDAPPPTDSPPAAAAPAATSSSVVTPPAAAAVAPAAPVVAAPATVAPDASAEHIARADRLEAHNRKLVSELETLRAKPSRGEPSAREKALDEAEKGYLGDSVGSVRKLLATVLGVDDPASKDVDRELTYLYHDLTKRELGVALDPNVANERENERTRRMLERDKRERTAAATPAAQADDAARTAQDAAQATAIAAMMPGLKHAERYPLTAAHAEALHGAKPEQLIWNVIKHEIAAGIVQPDANGKYPDDAALIDHASMKIEAQYQSLRDRFTPAPSTATPTQPTVTTDTKADPQPGVRTITNANASVAPATPPAAKPEPTTDVPKYRNEKERRAALAAKYFPGAS